VLREESGTAREVQSKTRELAIDIPEKKEVGIEVASSAPGVLAIRASDPKRIELPTHVAYWRATHARPVVVEAGNAGLVLRVAARARVARATESTVKIALTASYARASRAGQQAFLATVSRSEFDRYALGPVEEAPTDRAVFYVMVPPNDRVAIAPTTGAVD